MRHIHTVTAGLSAVVLLGAAVVGASDERSSVEAIAVGQPAPTIVRVDPGPADVPEAAAAKAAAGCAGIVVGATESVFHDAFEEGDTSAWAPGAPARFSAVRMLDLNLTVRFLEGFGGDHVLHVTLFTPKGHHYQTLSVPIASDGGREGSLRRVEGYPRPLPVRLLRESASSGLQEVTVSVPVGGTPIVANSVYGMWTAEASLDDQREACASRPFVLTP
jgi:hypothetical protein